MPDPVTPPVTPPATPPAAPPAWYSVLDAEHIGHVQTRGWDKLDPAAAALEAIKGHVSATKMLGAPADQLLRLPKAEDSDAWKPVWQKLGAPDKPEGYDFTGLDFDNETVTKTVHDALRNAAAQLNMPKAHAEGIAKAFHKILEDFGASATAESTAAEQAAEQKLIAEWGPKGGGRYEAQMQIVNAAKARLGITDEQFAGLSSAFGATGALQFLHRLGTGLGEDKFVRDPGPGGREVMTREQALARRTELLGDGRPGTGDQDFIKKYSMGDTAARREVTALLSIIAGAA